MVFSAEAWTFFFAGPWCLERILPGRRDSRPFAQLPRPDPRSGLVSRDTRGRHLSDGSGGADVPRAGRALARQPRVRVVSVSVKTVSADRSLQREEGRAPWTLQDAACGEGAPVPVCIVQPWGCGFLS
ncbi:uncharacterized protein LOC111548866 [Piliocolobus tephrosceles]|uniref:uncharacterized protein LOC111548866 n=1 Tax=Piliocolobus tephrosceles TaxID=591936 RepID=UPI000E6B085F|nr:uncharacterized protein LOC111548866 [Piliocolobus tephrosceles]